jgi:hypothetical protein
MKRYFNIKDISDNFIARQNGRMEGWKVGKLED